MGFKFKCFEKPDLSSMDDGALQTREKSLSRTVNGLLNAAFAGLICTLAVPASGLIAAEVMLVPMLGLMLVVSTVHSRRAGVREEMVHRGLAGFMPAFEVKPAAKAFAVSPAAPVFNEEAAVTLGQSITVMKPMKLNVKGPRDADSLAA